MENISSNTEKQKILSSILKIANMLQEEGRDQLLKFG